MTIGFDRDLYVLPFDHRGSFETKMFGWEGPLTAEQTAQIAAAKQVIYDGFNPATPASVLEEILVEVEQVLVMTVNPGFGHQHFIHTTLPKIRRVRRMVEQLDRPCDVEVDGGIDATTAPLAVDAGANVLVAGSAIFTDAESVAATMKRLANAE